MPTYFAVGVYRLPLPDRGREARLAFETLDAALGKVRDWVEADEIDDDEDAPMFTHYLVTLDPAPLPLTPPAPFAAPIGKVPPPTGGMRLVTD